MAEKSLAEQLREARTGYNRYLRLEMTLEDMFYDRYGENWYETISYDFYDDVIIVDIAGRDPSEEDAAFFRSLGFTKVTMERVHNDE